MGNTVGNTVSGDTVCVCARVRPHVSRCIYMLLSLFCPKNNTLFPHHKPESLASLSAPLCMCVLTPVCVSGVMLKHWRFSPSPSSSQLSSHFPRVFQVMSQVLYEKTWETIFCRPSYLIPPGRWLRPPSVGVCPKVSDT